MLKFFTITGIHITDKEAPNQLIQMRQSNSGAGNSTSIHSPVMMWTTHVLDAAIQTINASHKKLSFDLGISPGDTSNSTSYNELRRYVVAIDGKVITSSSGAHAGADSIDYQRPCQATSPSGGGRPTASCHSTKTPSTSRGWCRRIGTRRTR